VLAHGDGLERDLDGGAVRRLRQVDVGGHGHISPLHRAAGALAAEGAPERARAEERLEDVRYRAEALEIGGVAAGAQTLVPVAVIGGTPVAVRKDLVGLRGLLELLLGVGIVAVDIGVQLAGEPAERLLDLGGAGASGHAQDLVVVAGDVSRRHQRSSYTSAM
jgi:hypothetical protein